MKSFTTIDKKGLISDVRGLLHLPSIFDIVMHVWNEYQESEQDGADYIFNLDDKNDLITCIRGGLNAYQFSELVAECKKKDTRFFFFGQNHSTPVALTDNSLKAMMIDNLDTLIDFVVAYPFDGACRKLYTHIITNTIID